MFREQEIVAEDQDVRVDVNVIKSLTVNYCAGSRDCGPSAEDQDVRADVNVKKV